MNSTVFVIHAVMPLNNMPAPSRDSEVSEAEVGLTELSFHEISTLDFGRDDRVNIGHRFVAGRL